ncbi:hypothetical protein P618_200711 [Holospora obtusa F1]|uniref:Uncharacterized protein n=1 Tax=Holospora obtusa F1 TaxID=1399147 RepID=W6TDH1_HOLOB|nr:hypothetical protein [Holospora obtusa]ETZ07083.1 hypothetical protein P618_200711 [Holospora obtusa F1]
MSDVCLLCALFLLSLKISSHYFLYDIPIHHFSHGDAMLAAQLFFSNYFFKRIPLFDK